jgi:hypothetical protein
MAAMLRRGDLKQWRLIRSVRFLVLASLVMSWMHPALASQPCAAAAQLQQAFSRWIRSVYEKHEDIEDWHPYSNCIQIRPDSAVLAETERRLKVRFSVDELAPVPDPVALLPTIRQLVASHGEYASQSAQDAFERLIVDYLRAEPFEFAAGNWRGEHVSGSFVIVVYRPNSRTVLALRTGFSS